MLNRCDSAKCTWCNDRLLCKNNLLKSMIFIFVFVNFCHSKIDFLCFSFQIYVFWCFLFSFIVVNFHFVQSCILIVCFSQVGRNFSDKSLLFLFSFCWVSMFFSMSYMMRKILFHILWFVYFFFHKCLLFKNWISNRFTRKPFCFVFDLNFFAIYFGYLSDFYYW